MESKKRVTTWRVVMIAAVVAVLGLASYAVYAAANGSGGVNLASDEQLVPVRHGDFIKQVTITGSLSFPESASLSFGSQGKVGEVLVRQGETVEAGQLLATLDGVAVTTLSKAYAQAQRDVRAAEAALDEALEADDDAAEAYRALFRKWMGVELTDEEITQPPQELLASWGTDLRILFDPEQRFRDIRQGWFAGGLPRNNPDTRWNEVVIYVWMNLTPGAVVGTCDKDRPEIDGALCVQEELAEAWDALTRADGDPFEREILEADLTLAQAALEEATERLEGAALIAPMDGLVTHVGLVAGESADGSNADIRVINPSVISLMGSVDQVDILSVTEGGAALVTLDALPGQTLEGSITYVAATPDDQQGAVGYPVEVTVTAPEGMVLRQGLTGSARIVLSQETDVLMVPVNAIRGTSDNPIVRVVRGSRVSERSVVLGDSDDFWAVVREGLEEGEEVIVAGQAPGGQPGGPGMPGPGVPMPPRGVPGDPPMPAPEPGIPAPQPDPAPMPEPDFGERPMPAPGSGARAPDVRIEERRGDVVEVFE